MKTIYGLKWGIVFGFLAVIGLLTILFCWLTRAYALALW